MFYFYPKESKQCAYCQCDIKPEQLVFVYEALTYLCGNCYGEKIRTTTSSSEDCGNGS